MLPPQAVLFDALGTLVELEPPGPLLRRGLKARAGVEIGAAEAERAIAAEISYYRAHLDEGRDHGSLAALRRRCAEVLRAALPAAARAIEVGEVEAILLDALRFTAFPDAAEAIRAIRRWAARAIVVSNWDASLEDVLERLGLAREVDAVVTSARAGARKPSAAIFARAIELAGVAPEQAVHVGDSVEEDVAGARAAGIAPILLRRDGGPGPPGVRTIASLRELPGELRGVTSGPSGPPQNDHVPWS
ncbi:MAG: HAD family hydrolase [Solirubrobacterales bacterium]|nr:HAD family hydrolase [Solirubrobacterales bacterium]MBV9165339.1 HAD family hydrolase [Solirubrobacterales bacterium]